MPTFDTFETQEVVSVIPLVLKSWLDNSITKYKSEMKYILYSDDLEYTSLINKLAEKDSASKTGSSDRRIFPLFGFKRNQLTVSEILSSRSRKTFVDRVQDFDSPPIYNGVEGYIDVDFAFWDSKIQRLEHFEVNYLARGMSNIRKIDVEFPEIGTFSYELWWSPLENLVLRDEESSKKALYGTCRILGWFFTFSNTAKKIHTINLDTYYWKNDNQILWSDVIT